MLTYQDFTAADTSPEKRLEFIVRAVNEYRASDDFITAGYADEYDAQRNTTICKVVKTIYSASGKPLPDYTAANNRIANNFFHRLNSQRVSYSLGNGVSFTQHREARVGRDGRRQTVDQTKALFTKDFDTTIKNAGMTALEHGAAFLYLTDAGSGQYRVYRFTRREFVPLYDEEDGRLRAGIRFWSLDWDRKPAICVLYDEDGFTVYRGRPGTTGLARLEEAENKQKYRMNTRWTKAHGEEIAGESNFGGALPIVPLYGNDRHESTLIGLRALIDSHDLVMSGLADTLQDCATIYWLVGNAGGMEDKDLEQLRDRLKFLHIAAADTQNSSVTPYTQDIPHAAHTQMLQLIEDEIYTGFGAFNVKSVSAGQRTATEINASYQPMDEEADAFEYQIIETLQKLLDLIGVEDVPTFQRNRIANQSEQVQMVMNAANYLDELTVLKNLPMLVSVDEIDEVLENKFAESRARKEREGDGGDDGEE